MSSYTPRRARGALIVVEGLDKAGKSTQCARLVENLKIQGREVLHLRFPDRTTPTGKMIDSYLKGESQLDDHAIHLHFSANRWEAASKIKLAIASGKDVVIDRYYYSGVVYSAAKDIAGLTLEWASWPEIGLPRCDICLFLSISVEEAEKRGGFGSEKYELKEMQNRVRVLFEGLVENNPEEFVVINAGKEAQEVEGCILREVAVGLERVADGGALREVTMKQFQGTPQMSPE
ncbi:MAG: Thymidylate kinase [Geoglossum simile]|nr:MAG: Thymidylate kinase [Geoglossum simile]